MCKILNKYMYCKDNMEHRKGYVKDKYFMRKLFWSTLVGPLVD